MPDSPTPNNDTIAKPRRIVPGYTPDEHTAAPPWDEGGDVRVDRVEAIVTAPDGVNLVVVRVRTNVDGLVGLGCATFTQRAHVVATTVRTYLAPLVCGRSVHDITDIWHTVSLDSYWRGGPVLHNALAGLDMALWDVKGKLCEQPVWQLLGGRVRTSADAYTHASGRDTEELIDQIEACVEAGYRHVRCQVTVPGTSTYGAAQQDRRHTSWDPEAYVRFLPEVIETLTARFGDRVRLLHDVHERLTPREAIRLLRALEPYDLFFVEDPVAPEDMGWLPEIRRSTTTPLAFGELLSNMRDQIDVISARLVDYLRCHVSALGGITPTWRLAVLAELHGVRTAWHGPRDVSPVGHAANLAMDIASPAFGIHEHFEFSDAAREIFPGTPVSVGGAITPRGAPGLGIGLDTVRATRYPPVSPTANWHYSRVRRRDGTAQRP